jgi:multiple sugar transport system substrate-binding protein
MRAAEGGGWNGAAMTTAPDSRSRLHGSAGLVVAAIAGLALTGCADSSEPVSYEPVTLSYQDWSTDWFPPMAREMLGRFYAFNPNIIVFYSPDPEDLAETMLEEMRAGTAPDVFQGCCTFFPIWAQEGHMLDLRPYVERDLDDEVLSDWDRAQYEAFVAPDGARFGVPKYHGALALYYNKDLFDEHGVAYPDDTWTQDDYLDAMRQLTLDTDADGSTDVWGGMIDVSWDRVQIHVNAWGGNLVEPADASSCAMDDPPALAAIEWLRARMWDDKVMATLLDVQNVSTRDAFIEGTVATVEDGSWALKDILAKAPFRVGIAPLPAGPAGRVTLATTDGFGIYAGTQHPEEAWQLLRFLISDEYALAMARANLLQPAKASLVDDWARMVRREFPAAAADVDIAAFADGQVKGYSVTAEVFPNMADATSLAYAAWDSILTLGQGSVDQLEGVCAQIEAAQPAP